MHRSFRNWRQTLDVLLYLAVTYFGPFKRKLLKDHFIHQYFVVLLDWALIIDRSPIALKGSVWVFIMDGMFELGNKISFL